MIKTIEFTTIAISILTFIACLFKTLHFPGAGLLLLISGLSFCLLFNPIVVTYIFQHKKMDLLNKINYSLAVSMGAAFILSIIFKFMKLAGVNLLMIGSTSILLFVVAPTYFISTLNKKISEEYTREY